MVIRDDSVLTFELEYYFSEGTAVDVLLSSLLSILCLRTDNVRTLRSSYDGCISHFRPIP